MSTIIPFNFYRELTRLEVQVQGLAQFAERHGSEVLVYRAAQLKKAVEGLKKSLFEFQGAVLLAQLEASQPRKGDRP